MRTSFHGGCVDDDEEEEGCKDPKWAKFLHTQQSPAQG